MLKLNKIETDLEMKLRAPGMWIIIIIIPPMDTNN